MTRPSLRALVLWPVLLTITLGFVGFAVWVDTVDRRNRIADIDAELLRAERNTVAPPGPAGGPGPPAEASEDDPTATSDVASQPVQMVVGDDGSVRQLGAATDVFDDATIEWLAEQRGTFTLAGDHRVRVSEARPSAIAITALPLEEFSTATSEFRRALATGGVAVLVLVGAVVWLVTSALIRPVTRLTDTASRLADGDLDTPFPPPSGSRELADLSDDLDRMLTRLRTTLADNERATAEATKARDDMRQFLADMAHELRTPLTALKGYSDLHAGGMLAESVDVDRAMARIGSESERLSQLATDMLQLARGELIAPVRERVELGDVVESVVDDVRAAHPDRSCTLTREPGATSVLGDADRLHQAVLNLAANACHHSPAGSPVEVTVAAADGRVEVRVVDHGPGVPAEEAERIFVPFYRAERSRAREGRGGAGLGLALTAQIAAQHDGTIQVTDTPGGGATFTLSLPLA